MDRDQDDTPGSGMDGHPGIPPTIEGEDVPARQIATATHTGWVECYDFTDDDTFERRGEAAFRVRRGSRHTRET